MLAATIAFAALFGVYNSAFAYSSVTNKVSVESNGGESHTTVKTTINGEVVEDVTIDSDEDTVYSSHVESENDRTVTTATSTTYLPATTQLQALVEKLRALIALYEKLLTL